MILSSSFRWSQQRFQLPKQLGKYRHYLTSIWTRNTFRFVRRGCSFSHILSKKWGRSSQRKYSVGHHLGHTGGGLKHICAIISWRPNLYIVGDVYLLNIFKWDSQLFVLYDMANKRFLKIWMLRMCSGVDPRTTTVWVVMISLSILQVLPVVHIKLILQIQKSRLLNGVTCNHHFLIIWYRAPIFTISFRQSYLYTYCLHVTCFLSLNATICTWWRD